jgi:hypothetical protein
MHLNPSKVGHFLQGDNQITAIRGVRCFTLKFTGQFQRFFQFKKFHGQFPCLFANGGGRAGDAPLGGLRRAPARCPAWLCHQANSPTYYYSQGLYMQHEEAIGLLNQKARVSGLSSELGFRSYLAPVTSVHTTTWPGSLRGYARLDYTRLDYARLDYARLDYARLERSCRHDYKNNQDGGRENRAAILWSIKAIYWWYHTYIEFSRDLYQRYYTLW